jgi:hypothetical protein
VKALAAAVELCDDCQILLAGKVIETQEALFREAFHASPAFQRGDIHFAGTLPHNAHLAALIACDLVITQPGYSTLCEAVAAEKPIILVYGFFAYYEQYANFVSAAEAGLCLTPVPGQPWLQTGAFYLFGSPGPIPQSRLNESLRQMLAPDASALEQLRQNQRLALRRHPNDAVRAIATFCEERGRKGSPTRVVEQHGTSKAASMP